MKHAELATTLHDTDPQETQEWLDSFDALLARHGSERAHYVMTRLLRRARVGHVKLPALLQTPYINTISTDEEPAYPGDETLEKRIRRYIRWNAVAMVMRANELSPGIGGHLATYASAATLYEVGFNHFFRGRSAEQLGDLVFFQGHASPGIYARAYLEGRICGDQLRHFRREVHPGRGLSSYPHPRLMPEFWQFPTVSMGLGPISAIYQARYNRYLMHRGLLDTSNVHVWAFVGDGETDEPETLGALHLAAREKLDNLTFVVNCNLQRLDGPVRGNGKIIQELEAVFNGAGWRVVKVVWGREWDALLAADSDGLLVRRMGEVVDGQYQKYSVESGDLIRNDFFGAHPKLKEMVSSYSDDALRRLRRGGHDFRKVYAAYRRALEQKDGRPTVVLAKTVKGWTLGADIEGRNVTHQQKKLSLKELAIFRDRLALDIPDKELLNPPFLTFDQKSREYEYLMARRQALGGFLPQRQRKSVSVGTPKLAWFERFLTGSGEQAVSTTGAFGRMLSNLLSDKELGQHIVPIIPDEARTFGLDALFRKYGIYSSVGQLYEPVDAHMMLSYREAKDGQVLEEGICEAGSMASFVAAGTSYSSLGKPMVPMYIFYSMFGFQRTGDQIWAAGDQRCRGFLLGATAGRTTLNGEGLQHADGHSLLLASCHPHVRAYDAAFAYEIAVIVQHGLNVMCDQQKDVIYYLTLENDTYPMPAMAKGVEQGIIDGAYLYAAREGATVQLFGSGPILPHTIAAQQTLEEKYGVKANVWSVTSYSELRREALDCERHNMLHPQDEARLPRITRLLANHRGPVIATTDYLRAVPDQIARWVDHPWTSLGTDGFGLSDTREALRRHFGVDTASIVVAALGQLARIGEIDRALVEQAISDFAIERNAPAPSDDPW